MAFLTCLPDAYLSEAHLETFFNDFHGMINAGLSEATIFSSLVNNVRHVYMATILGANEELLSQLRENAQQQAALQHEHGDEREDERGSPPRYGFGNPKRPASFVPSAVETPRPSGWAPEAPARFEGGGTAQMPPPNQGQVQQEEICWPANTFTLHVGSHSVDIRRDLPDWGAMNKSGWTERLDFKVFKYKEPGTILISVLESTSSPQRMMANLNDHSIEGWKKRLEFYAYGKARPGTQMIWVAHRGDPERCIFLKGGLPDTSLDGWRRKFEFWVPK